jgi:hypothetical protein
MVVCPDRLVAIGVTPKSFGALYFSGREAEGVAFLGNDTPNPALGWPDRAIPGSPDRTSWLRAMEALAAGPVPDLRIDYSRYRRLVLLAAFGGGSKAVRDPIIRKNVIRRLSAIERWILVPGIRFGAWIIRHLPAGPASSFRRLLHRKVVRSRTLDDAPVGSYHNMLELFARPPSSASAARSPR